jgi:uncharacterized protein YukE
MSSQAYVDPDELDRLADGLERFGEEVRASIGQIQGRFSALSGTWRDTEYQRFARDFEQTLQALNRILVASQAQITSLRSRSSILREYPG